MIKEKKLFRYTGYGYVPYSGRDGITPSLQYGTKIENFYLSIAADSVEESRKIFESVMKRSGYQKISKIKCSKTGTVFL